LRYTPTATGDADFVPLPAQEKRNDLDGEQLLIVATEIAKKQSEMQLNSKAGKIATSGMFESVMWVGESSCPSAKARHRDEERRRDANEHLVDVQIEIQYGEKVSVGGVCHQFWVKSNLHALKMLALAFSPSAFPPFPPGLIDLRLRHLRDKLYRKSQRITKDALVSSLMYDQKLSNLLLYEKSGHTYRCQSNAIEVLKSSQSRGRLEEDGGNVVLPTLFEAFKCLETRVHEAFNVQRTMMLVMPEGENDLRVDDVISKLEERGVTGITKADFMKPCSKQVSTGDETMSSSGDYVSAGKVICVENLKLWLHNHVTVADDIAAASDRMPRTQLIRWLHKDHFLRYLIDCSHIGASMLPGNQSWCDVVINSIRRGSGAMSKEQLWEQLNQPAPVQQSGDKSFDVEIRWKTYGIQERFQQLVGGPSVALVSRVKMTDSVLKLREQVAQQAGINLAELQLLTLTDAILDNDEQTLSEFTLCTPELGGYFPSRLMLTKHSSKNSVIHNIGPLLDQVARSHIKIHIALDVALGGYILAEAGLGAQRDDRPGKAVIIARAGRAKISFTDSKPAAGLMTGIFSEYLLGSRESGNIHDDDNLFFDTVDIKLYGCECYVLRSVIELMQSLDTDRDGTLQVDEFINSLKERGIHGVTAENIVDDDGDKIVSEREMKQWLLENEVIANQLRRSVVFCATEHRPASTDKSPIHVNQPTEGVNLMWHFKARVCFLPSLLLCQPSLMGVPRKRLELGLAKLNFTLEMNDLHVLIRLSTLLASGLSGLTRSEASGYNLHPEVQVTDLDDGHTKVGSSDQQFMLFETLLDIFEDYKAESDKPITEYDVRLTNIGSMDSSSSDGRPCPITVEFNVCRTYVPLLCITLHSRVDVLRKTHGLRRFLGQCRIQASCENETVGRWVPFIEPWECSFLYEDCYNGQHQGGQPHKRLEITAPGHLVLDITYSLCKDLFEMRTLLNIASVSSTQQTNRFESTCSPYYFHNDTDLPVEFDFLRDGLQEFDVYRDPRILQDVVSTKRLVPSGGEVWLASETMKSARLHDSEVASLPRCALIRIMDNDAIDAEDIVLRDIRKEQVTALRSEAYKGLTCEVEIDKTGRKVVRIRSAVRLDNQTDVDLEVCIRSRHSGRSNVFEVRKHSVTSIPISFELDQDRQQTFLQIRPDSKSASCPPNYSFPFSNEESIPLCRPKSWDTKTRLRPLTVTSNAVTRKVCERCKCERVLAYGIRSEDCYRGLDLRWCSNCGEVERLERSKMDQQSAIRVALPLKSDDVGPYYWASEHSKHPAFHCHVAWIDDSKQKLAGTPHSRTATQSGQSTIRFLPFLYLENHLPNSCALNFSCGVSFALPHVLSDIQTQEIDDDLQESDTTRNLKQHKQMMRCLASGESRALSCFVDKVYSKVAVCVQVSHVDTLFPPAISRLQEAYNAMDADLSGSLTVDEFLSLWQSVDGLEELLIQLMLHFDHQDESIHDYGTDHRSMLQTVMSSSRSQSELQLESQIRQLIHDADKDGDQQLSQKEFVDLFSFGPASENRAAERLPLQDGLIYHEDLVLGQSNLKYCDNTASEVLLKAWRRAEGSKAVTVQLKLHRRDEQEGDLSLRYTHHSLDGEPLRMTLFCSHWISNQSSLPILCSVHSSGNRPAGPQELLVHPAKNAGTTAAQITHRVELNGYQLLGCDVNIGEGSDLCVRLQPWIGDQAESMKNEDVATVIGEIPYGTLSDTLKREMVTMKMPSASGEDQYGTLMRSMRVKVREAMPPFLYTKIVTLSPCWLLKNLSSYKLHARVSCAQYQVTSDKPIPYKGPDGATLPRRGAFAPGKCYDAIGKIKNAVGFGPGTAVCFSVNKKPCWCSIKDMQRVDIPVVGLWKVVTQDGCQVYGSISSGVGGIGSHLSQVLGRLDFGCVVEVHEIREYKKGRFCASFQYNSKQEIGWLKFDRRHRTGGMAYDLRKRLLVQVFEEPSHYREVARCTEVPARSEHTRPRASTHVYEVSSVSEKQLLGQTGMITVLPGESIPLTIWSSDASSHFLRVARHKRDGTLLWSGKVDIPQPTADVRERSPAMKIGDGKFVEVVYPTAGCMVVRDANMPPYAVQNNTGLELEYRVLPHSRPWWQKLRPHSVVPIYGVTPLSKDGSSSDNDARKWLPLKDYPKIYLRVANEAHRRKMEQLNETREDILNMKDARNRDVHLLRHIDAERSKLVHERTFEVHKPSTRWQSSEEGGGDFSVSTTVKGITRIVRIETANDMVDEVVEKQASHYIEVRMRGLVCSFVDKQQMEWSRFETEGLSFTTTSVGLLHVSVIRAKGFKSADWITQNDNYCVLSVTGETHRSEIVTSADPVFLATGSHNLRATDGSQPLPDESPLEPADGLPKMGLKLCPSKGWDFSFNFAARLGDMLHVELWDHDDFTSDDKLGAVNINIKHELRARHAHTHGFVDWFEAKLHGKVAGKILLCMKFQAHGTQSESREVTPLMTELQIGRMLFAANETDGNTAIVNELRSMVRDEDAGQKQHPPDTVVFAMEHGISCVQKWTDSSQQVTKSLEVNPKRKHLDTGKECGKIRVHVGSVFLDRLFAFVASLITVDHLSRTGQDAGRIYADNTLEADAAIDANVLDISADPRNEWNCEKAGSLKLKKAHISLQLRLAEFLSNLTQNHNAHVVAKECAGLDLVDIVNGPFNFLFLKLAKGFVDFEMGFDLPDLRIPRSGLTVSAMEQTQEVDKYRETIQWHVIRRIVTKLPLLRQLPLLGKRIVKGIHVVKDVVENFANSEKKATEARCGNSVRTLLCMHVR
jgi:Ca2+-binding EF-hand superfamily protein